MAKQVVSRPAWLAVDNITEIHSVSGCLSKDFGDYINCWKHNGYWLFDSPQTIVELAAEQGMDLVQTRLFFYAVYELEFDAGDGCWRAFAAEPSFPTKVIEPPLKRLEGYDVVTFSAHTSAECSPLSCNAIASEVAVNQYCLLPTFEAAKQLVIDGRLDQAEPGPYRIFAVYAVEWPKSAIEH